MPDGKRSDPGPTDSDTDSDDSDGRGVGPVDYDVLDRIGNALERSGRFDTVEFRPPYAPASIVAEYDLGYVPPRIDRAYVQVRWYETDDFTANVGVQHQRE